MKWPKTYLGKLVRATLVAGILLGMYWWVGKVERLVNREEKYRVVEVIDGDTIEVEGRKRVRFLGVNTPEISDKREVVLCMANRAKKELKAKLEGKKVGLVADPAAGNVDKYNRWLRYVSLEGEDMSGWLIKNGLGQVYSYFKVERTEDYLMWQREAKEKKIGLWSGKCDI